MWLPGQGEEGIQNTQRVLLAKLFAQQAPAQLVTNEKQTKKKALRNALNEVVIYFSNT